MSPSTRTALYESGQPLPFAGLGSATEPAEEEQVFAVIDLLLLGASGDGKTQLLVNIARTLDARLPDLRGEEAEQAHELLRVVLDASQPTPVPTAPGTLRHQVLRLSSAALLSLLGPFDRYVLLWRAGRLARGLAAALISAGVALGAYAFFRRGVDIATAAGAAALAAAFALWAARAARARLQGAGEIELVLWDAAGRHSVGSDAASLHAAARSLIQERRRAGAHLRHHAFAPVLLCNPIALGVEAEGSPYAGLGRLLPLFAALGGEKGRAMVARSRWQLARELCRPGADREELVTVRVGEQRGRVRRSVVHWHCFEGEEEPGGTELYHLHYDAGTLLRARRLQDGEGAALEVEYQVGPNKLDRRAQRELARFLAALAFSAEAVAEPPAEKEPIHLYPRSPRWQPHGDHARRTLHALADAARTPPR
jgi:hypothetical protein